MNIDWGSGSLFSTEDADRAREMYGVVANCKINKNGSEHEIEVLNDGSFIVHYGRIAIHIDLVTASFIRLAQDRSSFAASKSHHS